VKREDNRTRQMRKELEKTEARLGELQQERGALEEQLSGLSDMKQITELGQRLGALQNELDQLEERWLDLSSQLGD